jgi:hypothetical protein
MRHAFCFVFIFLAAQQKAGRQIDLKMANWNKSSICAGPMPIYFRDAFRGHWFHAEIGSGAAFVR